MGYPEQYLQKLRSDPRSVTELVAQALRAATDSDDDNGQAYWDAVRVLHVRTGEETLRTATALCEPGRSAQERSLGADILAQLGNFEKNGFALEERFGTLARLAREEMNGDPDVLYSALTALGHLQTPPAVDLLCDFADHPDRDIRWAVVTALGKSELEGGTASRAVWTLIALSEDPDPRIRDFVAFSFAENGGVDGPGIREVLLRLTNDPDDDARGEALRALVIRRDDHALQCLLSELEREEVSEHAITAARDLADPRLVEPLIRFRDSHKETDFADLLEEAIEKCRTGPPSGDA